MFSEALGSLTQEMASHAGEMLVKRADAKNSERLALEALKAFAGQPSADVHLAIAIMLAASVKIHAPYHMQGAITFAAMMTTAEILVSDAEFEPETAQ